MKDKDKLRIPPILWIGMVLLCAGISLALGALLYGGGWMYFASLGTGIPGAILYRLGNNKYNKRIDKIFKNNEKIF